MISDLGWLFSEKDTVTVWKIGHLPTESLGNYFIDSYVASVYITSRRVRVEFSLSLNVLLVAPPMQRVPIGM